MRGWVVEEGNRVLGGRIEVAEVKGQQRLEDRCMVRDGTRHDGT